TNACTVSPKKCTTSEDAVESCEVGSNGCTALNVVSCAKGELCKGSDTPTCFDPVWAAWPMPNSQTDSNAGAPHLLSYRDNGDGTVTDNVTGLVWQQGVGDALGASSASSYCADLDLAGYQNWRLPTVIELVSLLDFDHSPKVSTKFFPNTPAASFRSSQRGWTVSFESGATSVGDDGLKLQVRCVR
ncbi:MAG TPA: DUF1566 domain-containing protein, partial [Polyangiaceae bacterium]|nr:DUF1566 domain-containing protein [Polyangiaceae bacterium]